MILFYSVVDYKSQDTCIPLPGTGEFFKKFRLPTTNDLDKSLVGKFTTYKELKNALKKLFEEVSSSTLDSEQ